jgi:hypothetical protein
VRYEDSGQGYRDGFRKYLIDMDFFLHGYKKYNIILNQLQTSQACTDPPSYIKPAPTTTKKIHSKHGLIQLARFFFNPAPPNVTYGLRGLSSWLWLKCD